jgi:hypothetical protein
MKIKLRELNGTYYLLLKKEFRELLGIDNEVELSIENGKIIIEALKEKEEILKEA